MKKFERIQAFLDSSWSWVGVVVGGMSLGLFFAWLPFPRATVQLIMICVFAPLILGMIWSVWDVLRTPLDDGWDEDEPMGWMEQPISPPRDPRFEARP